MTSAVSLQRSASAASPVGPAARLPNLPVIEHPMSRLGDRNDLSVRGSATVGRKAGNVGGLERSLTDAGASKDMRKSNPERILNWPPGHQTFRPPSSRIAVQLTPPFKYKDPPFKGVLPPLDNDDWEMPPGIPAKVDKFPLVGHIPKLPPLPSIGEQEEYLKGPGKAHVKSKEYNYQPRTTSELIDLIREKFTTGYYGIRHLFKSNDPSGKGSVSREALQRILYTLCGYITPDQYTKVLRVMHLEGKTPIHFESFVQYFKETEDKKNWVDALQTLSISSQDGSYPEQYLRRHDMRIHDPYTSMPFSDAIFKEKCKSKNFDAQKVFPESVFGPNGLILAPQLREAHATLGIYMTDEDFDKLWQRYDKEGTGALQTVHFFRICGLDPNGKPRQAAPYTPRGAAYPMSRQRPHSEIGHTNGLESAPELKKMIKKEALKMEETASNDKEKDDTNKKAEAVQVPTGNVDSTNVNDSKQDKQGDQPEKKIEIRRPPKMAPKFENIIDCLHYKFEEGYQAMLTAFQLFDFLNDNYIAKVDFRRVLQEFGFGISPTELDYFLRRSGLRPIKGQINYREFLNKYQNKSENSLTAKIAKDSAHVFHTDPSGGDSGNLSSEALETRLIDYFHGDFIKLLSQFKLADKYSIGVITGPELKCAVEKRLGYNMTETQWEQLKLDLGQDKDGLLPYTKFMEMFDIVPGSWNVKEEGHIKVHQISPTDLPTPLPVERLRERAKTEFIASVQPLPVEGVTFRTIDEDYNRYKARTIHAKIDELFRSRFHTFDKHFKSMDRKMTGRMSKWQFGALLKMTGLDLHPKELDRIWATLNIATDGMYSYSTLVQHFVHFKVPHEQKETIVYEDTTELVETAKKIQRERREEQMKRDHLARMRARDKKVGWQPETVLPGGGGQTPRAETAMSRASSVPSVPASRASFTSVQSVRTKSLLVKIRTDVVNNWDGLKSVFKYIDKNGTSTIPCSEMKEIMNSMHFSIDEEEKAELLKRFDNQRNGRFNYLQFMKCYAQRQKKAAAGRPHVYSKFTHQLEATLFKEHRTLRRAFRKLDVDNKGHLSITDFKRALQSCNISYTNEDFYHILTEFDHKMDGRISYGQFLKTMLNG